MIYDLQKANPWKRISAALFDFILLTIAAVLFSLLLSAALGYDVHADILNERYALYGEQYGVDFSMSYEAYQSLPEEELKNVSAAYAALAQDEQAIRAQNMITQLTLLIVTFGCLLAYLVLEFTVPMLLGNGQTLGKKIFGTALMRSDGVRVNGTVLFIRTVLGKFAIETMIPLYICLMIFFGSIGVIGPAVLLVIAIAEIVLIIRSGTCSLIHDALASTVAVDLASQMIFDTPADLIAYKQRIHAEEAARSPY